MIAQAPLDLASAQRRSTSALAADALTRIPTAHFHDMVWAQDAVAECLQMVEVALAGERQGLLEWASEITRRGDALSMVAVLSAVCDSVVAEAFRTKHDVKRVTASVSAFEHAVYRQLAATRQRKDADAMQDSDTAELSAGLVRIVHLHDRETAIHLDATGILARRIAQAMDLSDEQVVTIELAARLHDIGKVGVRKDVLCKPGSLADDEWTEMRLHAEIGAAVLSETPKLAHLAAIVRAHHERIDGAGYPDRLAGEEIPIEARVIAVADAFHAMTTVRPYRAALLPNDALEVLAEHAGQQFDADVVEATFELFRYVSRSQRAIA